MYMLTLFYWTINLKNVHNNYCLYCNRLATCHFDEYIDISNENIQLKVTPSQNIEGAKSEPVELLKQIKINQSKY